MRIAMIGTGYVGLVSGVCFSDFGHDVVCVDKDAGKIDRLNAGEVPIYEPGLDELLARNTAAGRLSFTTDLGNALQGAEAVFIAVGTPTRRGDGHADLTYVYAAAEEIAHTLTGPAVVVVKSTVPVGTNREVARRIAEVNSDAEIEIASNPEFLREGAAIEDFMRPDRVVVGAETARAEQVMREIYRPLNIRETPMVITGLESAEMIKYAANAFLATKITFINEVADLCEVTFKPNTDDMRDAPALTIVPALIGAGSDPESEKEGAELLPGVTWIEDPYACAAEADAIVVLTEWNQFRGLDLARLRQSMRGTALIDLRNIYDPAEATEAGFAYTGIGR